MEDSKSRSTFPFVFDVFHQIIAYADIQTISKYASPTFPCSHGRSLNRIFLATNRISCTNRHFSELKNTWAHIQTFDTRRIAWPKSSDISSSYSRLCDLLYRASARPRGVIIAYPTESDPRPYYPEEAMINWAISVAPTLNHCSVDVIDPNESVRKENFSTRMVNHLNRLLIETVVLRAAGSISLGRLFSGPCPRLIRLVFDCNDMGSFVSLVEQLATATGSLKRVGLIYVGDILPSDDDIDRFLNAVKQMVLQNKDSIDLVYICEDRPAHGHESISFIRRMSKPCGVDLIQRESFSLNEVSRLVRQITGLGLFQIRFNFLSIWSLACLRLDPAQNDALFRACHPLPSTQLLCSEIRFVALCYADECAAVLNRGKPIPPEKLESIEWLCGRLVEWHEFHCGRAHPESAHVFATALVMFLGLATLFIDDETRKNTLLTHIKRLFREVERPIVHFEFGLTKASHLFAPRVSTGCEWLIQDHEWWLQRQDPPPIDPLQASPRDAINEIIDGEHCLFKLFEWSMKSCLALLKHPSLDLRHAVSSTGLHWLSHLISKPPYYGANFGWRSELELEILNVTIRRMVDEGIQCDIDSTNPNVNLSLARLDAETSEVLKSKILRFV
jgi:hypothetical protein